MHYDSVRSPGSPNPDGKREVTHPDSLKPMCPILPMPSSCTSMPPAACIAASYSSQDLHDIFACTYIAWGGIRVSGMCQLMRPQCACSDTCYLYQQDSIVQRYPDLRVAST